MSENEQIKSMEKAFRDGKKTERTNSPLHRERSSVVGKSTLRLKCIFMKLENIYETLFEVEF